MITRWPWMRKPYSKWSFGELSPFRQQLPVITAAWGIYGLIEDLSEAFVIHAGHAFNIYTVQREYPTASIPTKQNSHSTNLLTGIPISLHPYSYLCRETCGWWLEGSVLPLCFEYLTTIVTLTNPPPFPKLWFILKLIFTLPLFLIVFLSNLRHNNIYGNLLQPFHHLLTVAYSGVISRGAGMQYVVSFHAIWCRICYLLQ